MPDALDIDGAGVDIISQPFWGEVVPRQKFSWVVMPTGRTSWVYQSVRDLVQVTLTFRSPGT